MNDRFIAICGPTASGKSAISVALAQKINAEIMSFDASQAFIGADIGSAKISSNEMGGIKHHLLDIIKLDKRLEAGYFIEIAENIFKEKCEVGCPPLLCVGTTMYLALFLEGIAKTGCADLELRQSLESHDNLTLYQMLQQLDPLRASSLHINDRLRVIRAIEICTVTGKTVSDIFSEQNRGLRYHTLMIVLCWDRDELAKRIELRVDQMLTSGLIDECKQILETFGSESQIFDSIGYAETLPYLAGDISRDELRDLIALHSKQLAKKQMTFLRRFPIKHSFECFPDQHFEVQKRENKGSRLDFMAESLSMEDLVKECRNFMHNDSKNSLNRVLYVDATSLLQALAVS